MTRSMQPTCIRTVLADGVVVALLAAVGACSPSVAVSPTSDSGSPNSDSAGTGGDATTASGPRPDGADSGSGSSGAMDTGDSASGNAPDATEETLTLTAASTGTGGGTISIAGSALCANTVNGGGYTYTCNPGPQFARGTTVAVTEAPLSGSTFVGWSGACSGTATTCNVVMSAAEAVTATFQAETITPPVPDAGADTGVVADSGGGRNVLLQPFSTYSPWNMPLGTGTTYEAVGLGTAGRPAIPNSTYDDNNIMVFTPTAPSTVVAYNAAGWTGGNRCDFNSYPLTYSSDHVPLPANFLLPDSAPADTENNQIAVMEADGQTMFETAAGQRCSAGGPLVGTNQFGFGTTTINLYTDGAAGLHGALSIGSNVGGTIRLGEIMPGSGSPIDGIAKTMNHVLEFESNGLFGQTNYWATHNIGGSYVPPATNGDGGDEGILIALLPTFNFNALQTPPARSIAWTLIHYGAWEIDNPGWSATGFVWEESSFDTANGTQQCAALGGELGNNGLAVYPGCNGNNQFHSNWGYYVLCDQCNNAWEQDIAVILANLQVVTNYDLSTFPIAKLPPGTLLAPLLPPVTPP